MDRQLEEWLSRGRHFDYLGFDVFYRHEGSGPNLLLIHGYPFNSFDWRPIWDALTERFTVIAPDMLGMGFSAKPVEYEYSVHDHADMHEALLAQLEVHDFHILAHDIGDSVGQELLSRYEERDTAGRPFEINSITWLNGGMFVETYKPRLIQKLTARTPVGALLARYPLPERAMRKAINEVFGPNTKPSDELWQQLVEILGYNDGQRVLHKVGRFIVDRYHHRNRWVRAMRQTTVPMRLIDGPCDPNSGSHMAQRYSEVIPNADVVMLADDIGHWPQIEDPEATLRHFLEFIDARTRQGAGSVTS